MITLTREEAQQVLDALEEAQSYTSCETWSPSMTEELRKQEKTLRAKIAQPEPKPSAWAVQEGVNLHDVFLFEDEADEMCHLKGDHAKAIPLYTAPPQREWQGLTDEEKNEMTWGKTVYEILDLAEAKLKEKNT